MAADLQYTLGIDPGSTGKALDGIRDKLLGLGTVAFGGAILARGFQFNQTMYDGERAIRAIVQQFQGLNAEAAKPIAASAMQKLVDLEPKVAGSLQDIVQGFVSTAAASAGVGLSVDQNIDLVGRFANALGKMSMPIDQVGQELRSILTGNIGADSQLAKTLGITNEMVDAAKKAGNLYQVLRDRIGELGEAGDNAATAFSSFQSSIDKAAGALASGLFETAVKESGGLSAEIDKNSEAFKNLGAAIGLVAQGVVKFGSLVNDATKSTAKWVAIWADVITTGRGFEDVRAEMDAIANAEEHAAEVAKKHAEAEKEAAKQAKEANAAKAKSAKDAAAATEAAGLTNKPKKGKGKTKAKDDDDGGFDADAAAKAFDAVLDKQEQLNQLKRSAAMDDMTAAEKVAALQKEIAQVEEEKVALQNDFVQDQGKILDAEIKQAELQREIAKIQKQQNADAEDAAKKAEDKAEHSRRERAEKERARNESLGELAILREQAAGHDKNAEAIAKQMRLERDKQEIMDKEGATAEDATRRAKEKMALEDRIAKRKEKQSDKGRDDASRDEKGTHIGGVQNRRMMGGGVKDFEDLQKKDSDFEKLQKKDSDFEKLQKGKFGAGALAPRNDGAGMPFAPKKGGVDDMAKNVSQKLGSKNSVPLSTRMAEATSTKPPKDPDASKTAQADPVVAKLDAMLSELTRLRTGSA